MRMEPKGKGKTKSLRELRRTHLPRTSVNRGWLVACAGMQYSGHLLKRWSEREEDLAVCLTGPSHRLLIRSNYGDMVRTAERSKVRETEHRVRPDRRHAQGRPAFCP